jgi:serine/threonine protein phosphatase PrpC
LQLHQFAAGTDLGNARDNNEDTYVCAGEEGLWIVADGMGGHEFGEAASAITAHTLTTMIRQGHGVNKAIETAHQNIKDYAQQEAPGTTMGTTLVLLLSGGSLYNVFWVGDSRGYLFDGTLRQLTSDHSLLQSLVDKGELTAEEAAVDPRKNAITKALGVQALDTVRADSISDKWQPGQEILLCSDGLSDCVSDPEIESILREDGSDQDRVDKLIEAALSAGGRDNITVVLVCAPTSARKSDSDTEQPDEDAESVQTERDDSVTRVMGKDRKPGS